MNVKMKARWTGKVDECDICSVEIKESFVDGKTKMGQWAIMCKDCHKDYGCGLGMGKGQLYVKEGEIFFKES